MNKSLVSVREITAHLNNGVAFTQKPASLGHEISEARMARLRQYTEAILAPLHEHVEEGLLAAEELIFVFSCASLLIHARHVLKTDKLPMLETARASLAEKKGKKK
jgi:hypothetical protein